MQNPETAEHQSSAFYAVAIAETLELLANDEIACHPAGAAANLQLDEFRRLYVAARDREAAERRALEERRAFHANRVAAALGRRAA